MNLAGQLTFLSHRLETSNETDVWREGAPIPTPPKLPWGPSRPLAAPVPPPPPVPPPQTPPPLPLLPRLPLKRHVLGAFPTKIPPPPTGPPPPPPGPPTTSMPGVAKPWKALKPSP